MKKRLSLLAMAAVSAMCVHAQAGQIIPTAASATIAVDEFGNFTSSVPGLILSAGLAPDPSRIGGVGGVAGNVLVYQLGFTPVNGDAFATDLGNVGDLLRFFTTGGKSYMIFYSDIEDGENAPADVGFPNPFFSNQSSTPEIDSNGVSGTEGNNFFSFAPTANQPGFALLPSGAPITYFAQSDGRLAGVPLPAAALMGLPVIAMLPLMRRRRK